MRLHYPEVLPPACTFLFKDKNQWRLFESSNKSNNAALFFLLWRKWIYKGFVKISTRKKKGGSQSGLRVASLHWYVKKRATQNTLQKKTHDYNPITKRKDKQQPNEYKHNHNRWKLTTITCSSFCTDSVTDLTLYTSTDLQIQLY